MQRTEAWHEPHYRDLQDLIGELSTRSTESATRWEPTMYAATAPAPNTSTTTSSATSTSRLIDADVAGYG